MSPCAHGERILRRRPRARAPVRRRRGSRRGSGSSSNTGRCSTARPTRSIHAAAPAIWPIRSMPICTACRRGERTAIAVSLFPGTQQPRDVAARRAGAALRGSPACAEAPRSAARRGGAPRRSGGRPPDPPDPDRAHHAGLLREALARAVERLEPPRPAAAGLLLCSGVDAGRDRTAVEGARGDGVAPARANQDVAARGRSSVSCATTTS